MVLKKVRGGWVVLHHTKKGMIGKRINATKNPVSHAKALAIHKAIIMSKLRRGERI